MLRGTWWVRRKRGDATGAVKWREFPITEGESGVQQRLARSVCPSSTPRTATAHSSSWTPPLCPPSSDSSSPRLSTSSAPMPGHQSPMQSQNTPPWLGRTSSSLHKLAFLVWCPMRSTQYFRCTLVMQSNIYSSHAGRIPRMVRTICLARGYIIVQRVHSSDANNMPHGERPTTAFCSTVLTCATSPSQSQACSAPLFDASLGIAGPNRRRGSQVQVCVSLVVSATIYRCSQTSRDRDQRNT